jgi:type IV pilus assembly protein PilX
MSKTSNRRRSMGANCARVGKERGSTLLVAMVFLIVLTLMGLTVASMSTADERVARNRRDQNVALQAAEAALRDARADVLTARGFNGSTGATAGCRSTTAGELKGFCVPAIAGSASVWDSYIEDPNRSIEYGEMTGLEASKKFKLGSSPGSVYALPRYLVEAIPDKSVTSVVFPGLHWAYRITAIGYGSNPGTKVILQEVVRK